MKIAIENVKKAEREQIKSKIKEWIMNKHVLLYDKDYEEFDKL